MNTAAQSMGNSGSRRGLTKDRSTLDILEVLNEFFDKPIYIQVVRMWEALSASEPFYPGFTRVFVTIDQISSPEILNGS